MIFRQLYDRDTCTFTYLLADQGNAILIDPVREHVQRDLQLLTELGLDLVTTVETHIHADHVSGGWDLKQKLGCEICVPAAADISADRCVGVGDSIPFGNRHLEVRPTPGHTNGCTSYVLDDHTLAFTGDALMIRGCGRTDFQGGSAKTLYASVHRELLSLPEDCLLYPGHDYKGRTVTTVREEVAFNPRLGGGRSVEVFCDIMDNLGLPHPAKMALAVPANERLGRVD